MQKELEDLQPELVTSAAATEELMAQIELKMPGVMETRKVVCPEFFCRFLNGLKNRDDRLVLYTTLVYPQCNLFFFSPTHANHSFFVNHNTYIVFYFNVLCL